LHSLALPDALPLSPRGQDHRAARAQIALKLAVIAACDASEEPGFHAPRSLIRDPNHGRVFRKLGHIGLGTPVPGAKRLGGGVPLAVGDMEIEQRALTVRIRESPPVGLDLVV